MVSNSFYVSCVRCGIMPQVSIYIKESHLTKLDHVRGTCVKRSTLINVALDNLDEDWLRSLIK